VVDPDVMIVASGSGPGLTLPAARTVVAADGGLDRALSLGLTVDVVIGDLDSASSTALAAAEASGARIVRHPKSKDESDLELALVDAVAHGARRALVVASAEGRLDHLLASLLLLGSEPARGLELDAVVGEALVHVVRASRTLQGTDGELVSLLAVGGRAYGVATEGLAYPLRGETLEPGSSRGISNVFVRETATVTVTEGTLLAIRPDAGEGRLC
jgi:thiamine pyrophosphokinase